MLNQSKIVDVFFRTPKYNIFVICKISSKIFSDYPGLFRDFLLAVSICLQSCHLLRRQMKAGGNLCSVSFKKLHSNFLLIPQSFMPVNPSMSAGIFSVLYLIGYATYLKNCNDCSSYYIRQLFRRNYFFIFNLITSIRSSVKLT